MSHQNRPRRAMTGLLSTIALVAGVTLAASPASSTPAGPSHTGAGANALVASQAVLAAANTQSVASSPYMGWSSWSLQSTNYPGENPNGNYSWLTEASVMTQAKALVSTGLSKVGYQYVNIDSGWFADFGWNAHIDGNGRPAEDTTRFPDSMATVVANIHALGLKVGIYDPAGMTAQAYNANDPIYGSTDGCTTQKATLKDSGGNPISTGNQWSGYYAMDFSSSNPCGYEYVESVASMFASWGIDFLKIDGVTPGSTNNNPSPLTNSNYYEVAAWHQAFAALGWQGQLLLSYSMPISDASYWQQNSNGVRIDNDVECYCSTLVGGWTNSLSERWTDVVPWIPYIKPGFWPNLDSLDVGNEAMDGLTADQGQTYMTLWAMENAPLYIGDDLTQLDSHGLGLLTNTEVIGQDQAGLPAKPVNQNSNQQVWYVKNADGTYTVALYNLSGGTSNVTANFTDLGLSSSQSAAVHDMWSHTNLGNSTGSFTASLPAYGSRLLKLTLNSGTGVNDFSLSLSPASGSTVAGSAALTTSVSTAVTSGSAQSVALTASGAPSGVTVSFSPGTVTAGGSATMSVAASSSTAAGTYPITVTGTAASGSHTATYNLTVTTQGSGGGGSTYEADTAGTLGGSAVVSSCSACADGHDVGYLGSGGTLTFNKVSASAAGSYAVTIAYVDGDSGRTADISVNGGTATAVSFPGTNDNNWNKVQTLTVNVTLKTGTNTIEFSNPSAYAPDISTIALASAGGSATTYEADTKGSLGGSAVISSCSACADGKDVGYLGNGGTLTFNSVSESAAGSYTLTIAYVDGDAGRTADISVNGGTATAISFPGTNDNNWNKVQTLTISVTLKAGTNTIEFSNPSAYAPDISTITV